MSYDDRIKELQKEREKCIDMLILLVIISAYVLGVLGGMSV